MKIEIDKNQITEVYIKKNVVTVKKNYYIFLSSFGIENIYMNDVEMRLGIVSTNYYKHPHRSKNLIEQNLFYIKFKKKFDIDKFLYMSKDRNYE